MRHSLHAAAAGTLCLLLACLHSTVRGDNFTWSNAPVNQNWNNSSNWVGPAGQIPDDTTDSVFIVGEPANGVDPVLNINTQIRDVSLQSGGDLSTGNQTLVMSGNLSIDGGGTILTVPTLFPNIFNLPNIHAEQLQITNFGTARLQGGIVRSRTSTNISNGGLLRGYGILRHDSISGNVTNSAVISAEGGTLTIEPGLSNTGRFDWDGSELSLTRDPRLLVSTDATLDIRLSPGTDRFSGLISVGNRGTFHVESDWESDFGSTINLIGGLTTADAANITGGDMATFGNLDVVAGTGHVQSFWHGRIGTVRVRPFATLRINDALLDDNDGFSEVLFNFEEESTLRVDGDVTINRQNSTSFDWDGASDTADTMVNGRGVLLEQGLIINTDQLADAHDGTLTLNDGILRVNTLGPWTLGGELIMNDTGLPASFGQPTLRGSPLELDGGLIHVRSTSPLFDQYAAVATDLNIFGGGRIDVDAGSVLNVGGQVTIDATHGAFDIDGVLNLNAPETMPNALGGVNIAGAGLMRVAGRMDVTGNSILTPRLEVDGQVQINPFRILTAGGSASVASAAEIRLDGSRLRGQDVTNHGTVSGSGFVELDGLFSNEGTISAGAAGLTFDGAGNIDLDGVGGVGVINAIDGNLHIVQGIGAVNFRGELNTRLHDFVVHAGGLFNSGTMNLNGGAYRAFDLIQDATLNVGPDFPATIDARSQFHAGSVNQLDADLILAQDAQILAGASFAGTGAIVIPSGSSLILDDAADLGVQLVNVGKVAIGSSPGEARVDAFDQTPAAGAGLLVELGGTLQGAEYDHLVVNGQADLAGILDVSLIDLGSGLFEPAAGDRFQIVSAGSVQGRFDDAFLPPLASDLFWSLRYNAESVELAVRSDYFEADFDENEAVDADDFLTWQRNHPATSGALHSDGDANYNGSIDASDLEVWEGQFGWTGRYSLIQSSAAIQGVPEPTTLAIALLLGMLTTGERRRRAGAVARR